MLELDLGVNDLIIKVIRHTPKPLILAAQTTRFCETLKANVEIQVGANCFSLKDIFDVLTFCLVLQRWSDNEIKNHPPIRIRIQSLSQTSRSEKKIIEELKQFFEELEPACLRMEDYGELTPKRGVTNRRVLRIYFFGSAIKDEAFEIVSLIAMLYPGPIKWRAFSDEEIRLSDFPHYCRSDFLVFNWNKFAFLFALFLRDEPIYPTKLVLYSGVMESEMYNFTRIMNYGIFDYVISKGHTMSGCHTWKNVIQGIDKRGRRDKIRAVEYLLYRWSRMSFPPLSHFEIKVREGGYTYWGEDRKSYHLAETAFESVWKEEIREEVDGMEITPIWGRPMRKVMEKNSCFVLMPFHDPFNTIYLDHIMPVLKRMDILVERASDYFTTREIMKDIWDALNNCDFVIADLTGRNPNVLYELGIAHTLGKEVIMISQKEEDIPFDLRHLRCYFYEYTPRGCNNLSENLRKAAKEIFKKR